MMLAKAIELRSWLFAAGLLLALGPGGAGASLAQTAAPSSNPIPVRKPSPAPAEPVAVPERQPSMANDHQPAADDAADEANMDTSPKSGAVEASQAATGQTATPPPEPNPIRAGTATKALLDPKRAAALEQCAALLDGIDIEYIQLDSIRRRICGTRAPIKVSSIGKNPAVVVSPPAIMNCTVAATLHKWFKTSVQPTAQALGTRVVRIKNAASYMCRNQYGRTNTKLSEHALANALDISAFTLASGQTIKVLGNWPYGHRPTRPSLAGPPLPNPLRGHTSLPPDENGTPGVKVHNKAPASEEYDEALEELTRVATNPFFKPIFEPPYELGDPDDLEPEGPMPAGSLSRAEAKTFLRTIHADACKIFWTVLGPEANHAHRDHFHLDMRKRRYVKICQ